MIYIYDCEVYNNFFSATFKCVETKEITKYVIFEEHNDLDSLQSFLNNLKQHWLVGYNSYEYDDQILTYIYNIYDSICFCTSDEITKLLYDKSGEIINKKSTRLTTIPFKRIDLMKVGNIMRKSLKLIAVNLGWNKIQDLPIDPNVKIEKDQVDLILQYNLNDVLITEELYYRLKDKISLRWEITNKYKINVVSESDSGMANRLLEKLYSEKTGISIPELKQLRTPRDIIHFENVIFEDIHFESKELKEVLNELYSMKFFKNQPFLKKKIKYNGIYYQLGIGGLHSEDDPHKYEACKEMLIIDADIASMYPNIIINHNLKPGHLTYDFINIYKDLTKKRLKAKEEGNKNEADTLKITVNSVFGKTLSDKHWLYDPLVGLRTTINGQLYILMLIEKLTLNNFDVISANTDGIITLVHKDRKEEYEQICHEWEKQTKLTLEFTEYKKYIRRDVNNYVAMKKDGKVKEKGIFVIEPNLQQGIDKPIISKALYKYFIDGTPVSKTIRQSEDILEFCIAKRTDDKFINEYHHILGHDKKIDILQKTIRFYMTTNGGYLYKKDEENNKLITYCSDSAVAILNNITDKNISEYNINYNYYIKECNKIIDLIELKQLTLF